MSGDLSLHERLEAVGIAYEALWRGSDDDREAVIYRPGGGVLVITADAAHGWPTEVALGVYEQYEGEQPVTVLDVGTERVVDVVRYLLGSMPEGVDWAAWAAQRLDDDGDEVGR